MVMMDWFGQGNESSIDVIGIPDRMVKGTGWDVAGVSNATVNHTLVRKSTVTTGNTDWDVSAGTMLQILSGLFMIDARPMGLIWFSYLWNWW